MFEEALAADRDRALACLFLPTHAKQPALALLMLNAELARIPEIVSDPAAGLFRFQFWRDAVLGKSPAAHAWVEVLREACGKKTLDPQDLIQLIEARAALLDGLSISQTHQVESFVAQTAGHLQSMIGKLVTDDQALIERAGAAGSAYGLAGIAHAVGKENEAVDRRVFEDRARELAHQALGGRTKRHMFGCLILARLTLWQLRPSGLGQTPPWAAPQMALRYFFNRT